MGLSGHAILNFRAHLFSPGVLAELNLRFVSSHDHEQWDPLITAVPKLLLIVDDHACPSH